MGSAAPQALQEANKPSLWATQRSNEQQELHSGSMLKSHFEAKGAGHELLFAMENNRPNPTPEGFKIHP